jgi:hypothetical protein
MENFYEMVLPLAFSSSLNTFKPSQKFSGSGISCHAFLQLAQCAFCASAKSTAWLFFLAQETSQRGAYATDLAPFPGIHLINFYRENKE